MKTFTRTSLPESIKYNGETFKPEIIGSTPLNFKATIDRLKIEGKKAVIVEVLSRNLRVRIDLHGQPYRPTKWIFTN